MKRLKWPVCMRSVFLISRRETYVYCHTVNMAPPTVKNNCYSNHNNISLSVGFNSVRGLL